MTIATIRCFATNRNKFNFWFSASKECPKIDGCKKATNCWWSRHEAVPSSGRNASLCRPPTWKQNIFKRKKPPTAKYRIQSNNKNFKIQGGEMIFFFTINVRILFWFADPVSSSCWETLRLLTLSRASSRTWMGSYFLDLVSQHLTVPSKEPEWWEETKLAEVSWYGTRNYRYIAYS